MALLQGKPRTITGDFLFSQQELVSDAASNNNNDTAKEKKVSKIPSRCELNCKVGSLTVYELSDSRKTPFLILPKIRKVSRHKHDKEFFCLEYGTETDRFNIFLTIEDKSDADQWELKLCNITGQTPHIRPRAQTGDRPRRPNNKTRIDPLSSPSAPEGFSLAEQDGGDVPPTNDDATDETSRRDGQRTPRESHLGDVVGYETVSPNPPNSPNSGLIDEIYNKDCTDIVLEKTILKLKEYQQQEQQHQHETNDDRSSEILPLESRDRMDISQSSDQPSSGSVDFGMSRPGPLRPTEPAYQCTHLEIECSQENSSLTINKKDLDTGKLKDMFICYRGSVYLKSCPEILQSQLFQGTRILQVNKQKLVGARAADKAIDYIESSAGQTVDLLVQLFPLGVRVRLCVPSVAALGITLHGNEIMSMNEDGVMSRIADGLRCVCPALSTTDMPSPSAEQRSITAIGDRHVPFDATSEVVSLPMGDTKTRPWMD
eukprot:XP_011680273.1 PREDICTED: uncharacterized protein LOC105445872 [Strongylocentrotus purpuratus]